MKWGLERWLCIDDSGTSSLVNENKRSKGAVLPSNSSVVVNWIKLIGFLGQSLIVYMDVYYIYKIMALHTEKL